MQDEAKTGWDWLFGLAYDAVFIISTGGNLESVNQLSHKKYKRANILTRL